MTGILYSTKVFGNLLIDYTYALGLFLASLLILKIFSLYILARLKKLAEKTRNDLDDIAIAVIENIRPPFYLVIAVFTALIPLTINDLAQKTIYVILIAFAVYQVTIAIQVIIDHFVKKRFEAKENKTAAQAAKLLGNILKALVWIIALLFALQNFGVNVTSIIAGLGVGGIAVAFALQNILTDLFSSFAIYFDRPFEIGDFIATGKHSGTVKKIGLKTTRLKSLSGEEISIANKELTDSRVQNYKRMTKRRVLFTLGITYDTPSDKLRAIPDFIKSIIENTEQTEFNRCHFVELGDSALKFEIVYHVTDKSYDVFCDAHHAILNQINDKFAAESITFAYPTQTINLNQ